MVFKHLSATGTGAISPANSTTVLVSVTVNTAASSAVLKLYDGQDNTGTLVAQIDASAQGNYWFGGVRLHAGLYYDLSGGNADITIVHG